MMLAIKKLLSKHMKRQSGQAIILVLIALATGSAVVVPTLEYVSTSLHGSGISRDDTFARYAADAAVEYTIWQLKYSTLGDPQQGGLSPDNPLEQDSITVNGVEVPIETSVPTVSPLEAPPSQQSGRHLHVSVGSDPAWIKFDGTVGYSVVFTNYGTSNIVGAECQVTLPPGFTYVPGSTTGDFPSFTVSTSYDAQGRQVIYWSFTGSATDRQVPSGASKTMTFSATASVDAGISYYTEAWGITTTGDSDVSGPSARVWSSIYRLKANMRGRTIYADIGIRQDGTVDVMSYHY